MIKIPDHTRPGKSPSTGGGNILFTLAMLLALITAILCATAVFSSIDQTRNILNTDLPTIASDYQGMDKVIIRMGQIDSRLSALEKQLTGNPNVIRAAGDAVSREARLLLKDAEENDLSSGISQVEVILGRYEDLVTRLITELGRINREFNNFSTLAKNLRQEIRHGSTGKKLSHNRREQLVLDLDYAILLARSGVDKLSPDLIDPGIQPGRSRDSTRARIMVIMEQMHRAGTHPKNEAGGKITARMLQASKDMAAAIRKTVSRSALLRRTTTTLTRAGNRFDSAIPQRILTLRNRSEQHLSRVLYLTLGLLISLSAAIAMAQAGAIRRRRQMKNNNMDRLVTRLRQQKDHLKDQQRLLKQKLEQSIENGETWRDLFENAGDLIQILSPEGRFIQTNRAWHRTLGYSKKDLKQLTIFDIIHPDCRAHCMKVFTSIGAGDLLLNTTLVAKSGTMVEVEGHANLRVEDGRAVSTRCILRDVTAQHKIENEAAKAMRLEGLVLMTGGLAHDFNNLLTAVTGNLSLIKVYGGDNKKLTAKVEQSEKAIDRAREMVDRLMDFSRIEEPRIRPTALAPVIREAAEIIACDNNCRLALRLADDLPQVDADPGQIGQVIQNLVGNAAQAMDGGRIEINARTTVIDADNHDIPLLPGDYVKITVRDFGPGLPPERIEHIFEPYFTTKDSGRGLGLAISYAMIRKHHGLLTAANHPDGGAIFRIFLPFAPPTAGGHDA